METKRNNINKLIDDIFSITYPKSVDDIPSQYILNKIFNTHRYIYDNFVKDNDYQILSSLLKNLYKIYFLWKQIKENYNCKYPIIYNEYKKQYNESLNQTIIINSENKNSCFKPLIFLLNNSLTILLLLLSNIFKEQSKDSIWISQYNSIKIKS